MGKIDIKKKLKEKALFQSAFDLFMNKGFAKSYLPKSLETVKGQDILVDEYGMGAFSMVVVEDTTFRISVTASIDSSDDVVSSKSASIIVASPLKNARKVILTICMLLFIPSIFGMAATKINYDLLSYLPKSLETVKGQDITIVFHLLKLFLYWTLY